MKLNVKKLNTKIRVYFFSMLIGSIPALWFYGTEKASIGILLAILIVGCYTKDFVSITIFMLFVPLNVYFMYIPVVFMGGKTFNAFVNLLGFAGVLLLIIIVLSRKKSNLAAGGYRSFMILYCLTVMIYYPLNSYINEVGVLSMVWRLAPLMYCIILMHFIDKREKYMDEFVIVLILSTIISVGIGYLELFRGSTFYYSIWAGGERYRHGMLRMGSTQGDPNVLAEYILPILFLLNTGKVKGIIGKKLSKILVVAFTLMVFLTGSRMALLALLSGYGFYCLVQDKSWKKAMAVLVLLCGIVFLPQLAKLFNNQDMASSSMRLFLVGRAWDIWNHNILFGIGSDQFVIKEYWMNMNEWMKQLSEFGLIGFLLYLLFYVAIFVFYHKNKGSLDKIEKKDAALVLSAVVSFSLNSLSMDTYYHYIMWMLPVMVMWFFVSHMDNSRQYDYQK